MGESTSMPELYHVRERAAGCLAIAFILVASGCVSRYSKPAAAEEPGPEPAPGDEVGLVGVERLAAPSGGAVRFRYVGGAVYRVYGAPGWLTSLAFEAGEKIRNINIGDVTHWELRQTTSGPGAKETQHILVAPKQPDVRTTLIVTTNRRAYHLELRADEAKKMTFVEWDTQPAPDSKGEPGVTLGTWGATKDADPKPDPADLSCQ